MTWKICEEARKNVEDTDADFSVLCYNETEAEELAKYLNEKYGEWEILKVDEETETPEQHNSKLIPYDEELNLHEDFVEYDEILHWISKTGKRLTEIEEIYQEDFKIELANAMFNGVDFKKIYGGNTEKTRKQYVDEQLSDLLDEKKCLKAYQSDDLRRIEFLKRLIDMKIAIIRR